VRYPSDNVPPPRLDCFTLPNRSEVFSACVRIRCNLFQFLLVRAHTLEVKLDTMADGGKSRLCGIYLRDVASLLPRLEVDRCREASQHTSYSLLPDATSLPRRKYSCVDKKADCEFSIIIC